MAGADMLVITSTNEFQFWRQAAGTTNNMPVQITSSNFGLISATVCCQNGATKDVTFRRAADAGTGSVALTVNSAQTYLWAYSTNSTFGYHGPTTRGTVTANVGSG
jgi:hypothetical protein